ncbi:hypothetical protein BH09BAC1_BH09BAC1_09900 [soil metagenome]
MSMKKYLLTLLTTTALLFTLAPEARASHAMGADIFYECVGRDSFRITLNFYRDCFGTTAPSTASIGITNTCTGASTSVNAAQTAQIQPDGIPNGSEVSALCSTQIQNSTCNNGNLPGVQQYQYSFLWIATSECANWRISYDLNARNAQINTLQNPGTYDLYIEAFINNTTINGVKTCNNSPRFTNRPVPYFCYQDSIRYNHGTVDIDGDSLVYTLVQPLQNPGTTVPYAAGFSVTNPLSTNNTFTFNSGTGQMFFVPQQAQVGVITVRVDEYRNGVLIGSTMRDIQVVILGSPQCVPPYGRINVNGIDSSSVKGGVFTGPYNLEACPGDTIRFDIRLGGRNITLSSNATQALPGATFTTTNFGPDSILGQFRWITTSLDTGVKNFSLSYGINSCPIDRTAFQTVTITVLNGTYAGADKTYCTQGQPVQLNATGGNSFTWTPASGLSSTVIKNPLASPTVTTDYIVQSDLSARCKNRDTVRVTVVPNFILSLNQNDTVNICRNALVFLNVNTDTAYAPYTYRWTPSLGLSDSTIKNPVASPVLSSTYVVAVTSNVGCTLRDTLRVNVIGVGPQVIVTPKTTLLCPGSSVQLNSTVLPVTCGPSIGTGSCGPGNPPTARTYGTGTVTSSVTPFSGGSSDGRYQVLYRASNLLAAGYSAGTIFRMQLNVGAKASSAVFTNMTIRIGCTSATQLTRADWLPTSTQVFSSNNFLTSAGLNSFTFSQPYDWDGVSNLVIEFCYGDATSTNAGGNDLLLSTTVTYNASMSATSTTTNGGCTLPASSIPLAQPVMQVPNLILFICSANTPTYTYQWAPATGLSGTTIPNPTATPTVPTVYTLTVRDSACSGQDFATVNIDTARVNISKDTALCNADSVRLFVNVLGVITNACGNNGNGCTGNSTTVTVGNGTAANIFTTYPTPYGNYFESVKQQYLFRANDLLTAGVNPGRLTSMGFNIITRFGASVYRDFAIKIKCTNTTALTQGTPEAGTFVTVFTPKNISLPANGWTTHTFDNQFDWDGISNLIVEVCFNNDLDPTQTSSVTFNTIVASTNAGYTASAWYPVDNQDACAGFLGLPSNMGASNNRPNVRFATCAAAPPFTVRWTPINSLTNPNTANPTAFPTTTTTYIATVTTANGCTKVDSVKVSVGALPYTKSRDTTVCLGNSARLLISGSAGYTYNWTTGTSTLSCTNCGNPTATPTATTVYYVNISNGTCTVTDSIKVTVSTLTGSFIQNPGTLCVFDSTLLTANSGYSSYLWSTGSTTATTWIYTSGTYSVTVTDANGCRAADTITVSVATVPPVSLGKDTSICVGDSIVLTIGGGYATYNWNVTTTTNTRYVVRTTGNYQVTVTDANGCVSRDSIQVNVNTIPIVNLGPDTTICGNQVLGLNAGSQPGYTYLWQDGSTQSTYGVNTSGTYYVTVSGGANCTASDTIKVTVTPAPNVNLGPDIQSCLGQVVILRAGQGYASYLWSPTNTTRDSLVVTAPGGTYIVSVTDVSGCTDADTIVVSFNNPIVNLSDDTICQGKSTILDAGNFTSYVWSTAATTRTITTDIAGTYSVTVTDIAGCTATGSATITVVGQPTVIITASTDTICPGATTTLDAGPGFSAYAWSPSGNTQTITANTPGIYSVTVTNAGGCSATATYTISVYPLATLTLQDLVLCPGDTVNYSAPSGYSTYNWSNGGLAANNSFTATGMYYLTVTNMQGCQAIDTLLVRDGSFTVEAMVDPTQIDLGNSATLSVNAVGGSGNYSYIWTPSTYLNDPNIASPSTTPDSTLNYLVMVTDDSTGCTASDTITITVFSNTRYAFTDAFSPNNDGHNDVFFPLTAGNVAVTTFRIYNRWGELVHDQPSPWNGTINNTQQPMGTYVYYAVIEITTATGVATEIVQGSFTLLR